MESGYAWLRVATRSQEEIHEIASFFDPQNNTNTGTLNLKFDA